jgi:hypothetical protein
VSIPPRASPDGRPIAVGRSFIAQEDTMKHRIALIVALLTALGALFGISATAAQAAPAHYKITNGLGYCIADPGVGHVVYVRSGSSCNANFTFTNPVNADGHIWYLMRINGGTDCLNYDPANGFVYDNGCRAGDHNELWTYVAAPRELGNLATLHVLDTCNDTDNSRIYASAGIPRGCNLVTALQYEWTLHQV